MSARSLVGAALVAAVSTMCTACPAREPGSDVEGAATDSASTGAGASAPSSSGGTSTDGGSVACPPEETDVTFVTEWTVDTGHLPPMGHWTCVVEGIEFAGGALGLDLDCAAQEEWNPPLTHVSITAVPPLPSHAFVVGETVKAAHRTYAWGKFQRIERPDETLLIAARWGRPETDERGILELGPEICHVPDPVGRVTYHEVTVDVGDGPFDVPPHSHAEHGAYAAWTGNAAKLVKEKSSVQQYYDLDALVVRRAP